jgi:hypothetical protein
VTLGEFKVAFNGRNRAQVKKKALDYWVKNRERLELSLKDYISKCRLSPDERTITFTGILRTTTKSALPPGKIQSKPGLFKKSG